MRQGRYVFATSGCKHEVTVNRTSHGVCRELEFLDTPNPIKLQVRAVLDCAAIDLSRYASVLSIPSLLAQMLPPVHGTSQYEPFLSSQSGSSRS